MSKDAIIFETKELNFDDIASAEKIYAGSAEIIIKEWADSQATKKLILLKEIEIREKNLDKSFNFNKHCLYSGVTLATIAAAVGAYGVHVKADPVLLGTALAFISGIAGVFLWGYQRKD